MHVSLCYPLQNLAREFVTNLTMFFNLGFFLFVWLVGFAFSFNWRHLYQKLYGIKREKSIRPVINLRNQSSCRHIKWACLELQKWNHVELKQVAKKLLFLSIPWSIIVQLKCLCPRLFDFIVYFCTFFIVFQILYNKYLVCKEMRHLNPD